MDGFVTKYTFLVAVGPDTRSCIKVGPVLSFYGVTVSLAGQWGGPSPPIP